MSLQDNDSGAISEVESKIDNISDDSAAISTVNSKVDLQATSTALSTTESKVDNIGNDSGAISTVDSKIDVQSGAVSTIDSKVDLQATSVALSVVDSVADKNQTDIQTQSGAVSTIDSKVDLQATSVALSTTESKIDNLSNDSAAVSTVDSKIDVQSGAVSVVDSKVDLQATSTALSTTESKIDNLSNDSAAISTVDSKIDVQSGAVSVVDSKVDLQATSTALSVVDSVADKNQTDIQTQSGAVSVVDSKVDLQATSVALSTTESKIDNIGNDSAAISTVDSKIDVQSGAVSVVDSKVDLQATSIALSVVDSVADSTLVNAEIIHDVQSRGGTTYFVGKNGNDGWDGLTWATRRLTVVSGYSLCDDGDALIIGPGQFVEAVAFNDACITVVGSCAPGASGTQVYGAGTVSGNSQVFKNIEFVAGSGTVCLTLSSVYNCIFMECTFIATGATDYALVFDNSGENEIKDCVIYGGDTALLYLTNTCYRNIIKNNEMLALLNGAADGVFFDGALVDQTTLKNNSIMGGNSSGTGIIDTGADFNIICDNYVAGFATSYNINGDSWSVCNHEESLISAGNTTEQDLSTIDSKVDLQATSTALSVVDSVVDKNQADIQTQSGAVSVVDSKVDLQATSTALSTTESKIDNIGGNSAAISEVSSKVDLQATSTALSTTDSKVDLQATSTALSVVDSVVDKNQSDIQTQSGAVSVVDSKVDLQATSVALSTVDSVVDVISLDTEIITDVQARGGTIYFVGKTGNDAWDGLTWATRRLTVASGYSLCNDGDGLIIGPGSFAEAVAFNDAGITVIGCCAPGASGTQISGAGTITAQAQIFKNIEFTAGAGTVPLTLSSHNCIITECTIIASGITDYALVLNTSNENEIKDCVINGGDTAVLFLTNTCYRNIIKNNEMLALLNGAADGVVFDGAAADQTIFKNNAIMGGNSSGTGIIDAGSDYNNICDNYVAGFATSYNINGDSWSVGNQEESQILAGNTNQQDYKDIFDYTEVVNDVQSRGGTVYFVAKTGNDGNDGLTKATARLTVASGYLLCNDGDALIIHDGNYAENITFNDSNINVIGAPAPSYGGASITGVTTISGVGQNFRGIYFNYTVGVNPTINITGQGNTIEDCKIDAGGTATHALTLSTSSTRTRIINCIIEGGATAVIEFAGSCTNSVIKNNEIIADTAAHGIYINAVSSDDNIIKDNVVSGTSSTGTGILATTGDDNIICGNFVSEFVTNYNIGTTNSSVGNQEESQILDGNTNQQDSKDIYDNTKDFKTVVSRVTLDGGGGAKNAFTITGQCEVIVFARVVTNGAVPAMDSLGVTNATSLFGLANADSGFIIEQFWTTTGISWNPTISSDTVAVNSNRDANILVSPMGLGTAVFDVYCSWRALSADGDIS